MTIHSLENYGEFFMDFLVLCHKYLSSLFLTLDGCKNSTTVGSQLPHDLNFGGTSTCCLKKLHLILTLNLGAVHFSMPKVWTLPFSRDMYKSFGT